MIRAICLNPNIDRSYYIEDFDDGIRYKDNEPEISVGGKGINVTKVCHSLNEPVALYCFTGGMTGQYVSSFMEHNCTLLREVEVEGLTRETVNIIDNKKGHETEIVEKGPFVTEAKWNMMASFLKSDIESGDIVICSGISAPGCPDGVYALISNIARDRGALCFLDTNGDDLKESIGGHFSFWKPNQNELAELTGMYPTKDTDSIIAALQSLPGLDCENVLVSLGKDGGILYSGGSVFYASVPDFEVISTIGCGDSVVAGFAVAINRGEDIKDAFAYSMACGTLNSMKKSIASDLNEQEIEELLNRIKIRKIK